MQRCWHLDPDRRPTFSEIHRQLSEIISADDQSAAGSPTESCHPSGSDTRVKDYENLSRYVDPQVDRHGYTSLYADEQGFASQQRLEAAAAKLSDPSQAANGGISRSVPPVSRQDSEGYLAPKNTNENVALYANESMAAYKASPPTDKKMNHGHQNINSLGVVNPDQIRMNESQNGDNEVLTQDAGYLSMEGAN